MATRLYPNTKNETKLEILAAVPAGTFAKLNEFETKWKNNPEQAVHDYIKLHPDDAEIQNDIDYIKFNDRQTTPAVDELKNFLLYGWGRIKFTPSEWTGETKDPLETQKMLIAQEIYNVSCEMCEGVNWG